MDALIRIYFLNKGLTAQQQRFHYNLLTLLDTLDQKVIQYVNAPLQVSLDFHFMFHKDFNDLAKKVLR